MALSTPAIDTSKHLSYATNPLGLNLTSFPPTLSFNASSQSPAASSSPSAVTTNAAFISAVSPSSGSLAGIPGAAPASAGPNSNMSRTYSKPPPPPFILSARAPRAETCTRAGRVSVAGNPSAPSGPRSTSRIPRKPCDSAAPRMFSTADGWKALSTSSAAAGSDTLSLVVPPGIATRGAASFSTIARKGRFKIARRSGTHASRSGAASRWSSVSTRRIPRDASASARSAVVTPFFGPGLRPDTRRVRATPQRARRRAQIAGVTRGAPSTPSRGSERSATAPLGGERRRLECVMRVHAASVKPESSGTVSWRTRKTAARTDFSGNVAQFSSGLKRIASATHRASSLSNRSPASTLAANKNSFEPGSTPGHTARSNSPAVHVPTPRVNPTAPPSTRPSPRPLPTHIPSSAASLSSSLTFTNSAP
mmetsp:Transcript_24332/g.60644  ORF Transcript_24332/g.60644 Transcript_24332/m.60644 type:complete len:423 (+) Transcript_24332:1062-2330(+)